MEMLLETLKPVPGSSRQKQSLVMDELHRMARHLGIGAKLPTVRALSKKLKVNGLTLNKCLEKMEQRGVLRCLQGSGIYVDAGVDQKRIALVFGTNVFSQGASQFGDLILKCSAKRASLHNERFSFYIDEPSTQGVVDGQKVPVHPDLVDAFRDGKIDGVILIFRMSIEQELWIRAQGVPVVSTEISRGAYCPSANVVFFDYQSLIEQGVDSLYSSGCRTVGLIGAACEHGNMFRAALMQRGMTVDEKWIIAPSIETPCPLKLKATSGAEAALELLSQSRKGGESGASDELPDGLLITDDMMARGVFPVLSSHGVRLGQDLTVCSHTNKHSVALSQWEAQILRVQFDPQEIATALFDVLEALMAGKPTLTPRFIRPVMLSASGTAPESSNSPSKQSKKPKE